MKEFIDKLIKRLEEELIPLNQEITKYFYELKDTDNPKYIYAVGRSNALTDFKYTINQLAEEYKLSEIPTGWISVSERLPEYTDEYNVTVDVASEFGCYRTVKTVRLERIEGKESKWVIPQDEVYRVIAWCELPAPYTEGE